MTVPNQSKRAMMLVYYFPKGCGVRNPSGFLRKHGFVSWDGSVWFALEEQAPLIPVEKWRAAGCRVDTVPCVPEQWEFVRRRALDHLERQRDAVREAIDVQLAKAGEMLEDADRVASAKGVKKSCGYARRVLRRMRQEVQSAAKAALMFDVLNETTPLFEAVRHALATEEEAWYVRFADAKAKYGKPEEVLEEVTA